jgi:hypothetical protein
MILNNMLDLVREEKGSIQQLGLDQFDQSHNHAIINNTPSTPLVPSWFLQ